MNPINNCDFSVLVLCTQVNMMFVMLLWVYIHTGKAWKICLATVGIEPMIYTIDISYRANLHVDMRPLKLFYNLKLLNLLVFNHYHNFSPIMLQDLFIKREQVYNFRKTNCLKLSKCTEQITWRNLLHIKEKSCGTL